MCLHSASLFLPLISCFRKLKKLCRTLKDKERAPKEIVEQPGRRQQWHMDYDLEPFDGLTPEYMEMSEWRSPLCVKAKVEHPQGEALWEHIWLI